MKRIYLFLFSLFLSQSLPIWMYWSGVLFRSSNGCIVVISNSWRITGLTKMRSSINRHHPYTHPHPSVPFWPLSTALKLINSQNKPHTHTDLHTVHVYTHSSQSLYTFTKILLAIFQAPIFSRGAIAKYILWVLKRVFQKIMQCTKHLLSYFLCWLHAKTIIHN